MDQIVDRALHREVDGKLPADFALRIERQAEIRPDETASLTPWLWYTGMIVLAIVFVTLHLRFAFEQYQLLWEQIAAAAVTARLDLVATALLVVVTLELLGRRWSVRAGYP